MRVLFLDSQPLYEDLLPAGLRQIGCDVKTVPEVLNGELETVMEEFQPDFALMLGWSDFPTAERLAVIRKTIDRYQVPLVYWSTEDPCWFQEWSVPVVQRLSPDLVVTICSEYVDRYRAMGFEAACLPFGFNHEIYRKVAPQPAYACDIAVVANFYTAQFDQLGRKRSLQELLCPLLDQGYDLQVWGSNWGYAPEFGIDLPEGAWRFYLDHRQVPAVYNSAKIVIGLQNEFDYETNITMRTCEILGAGGFLLTSRTRAVEHLFTHKEHLVISSSPAETLQLVEYYLNHPDERAEIAAAGQRLVLSQHTYADRALELLGLASRLKGRRPKHDDHCIPDCPLPPHPYCPHDDSSGSCTDHSGTCSDHSGSCTDHSGSCTDQSGSCTDQSGSCTDQSGSCTDQSGSWPDHSGSDTGSIRTYRGRFWSSTWVRTENRVSYSVRSGTDSGGSGSCSDHSGSDSDGSGS